MSCLFVSHCCCSALLHFLNSSFSFSFCCTWGQLAVKRRWLPPAALRRLAAHSGLCTRTHTYTHTHTHTHIWITAEQQRGCEDTSSGRLFWRVEVHWDAAVCGIEHRKHANTLCALKPWGWNINTQPLEKVLHRSSETRNCLHHRHKRFRVFTQVQVCLICSGGVWTSTPHPSDLLKPHRCHKGDKVCRKVSYT